MSIELVGIILNITCTVVITIIGYFKIVKKISFKGTCGTCGCETTQDDDIVKYIIDAANIFKSGGENKQGIAHLESAINIARRQTRTV